LIKLICNPAPGLCNLLRFQGLLMELILKRLRDCLAIDRVVAEMHRLVAISFCLRSVFFRLLP